MSLKPNNFMPQIQKKTKKRSKKYLTNLKKIQEATKDKAVLQIEEAVDLLFSLEKPSFKEGPTVELHLKLNINPTKSNQIIKSSVSLPHGTGKKVRVAAFVAPENVDKAKNAGADIAGGEELIEKIKAEGKVDFDKAIAEPEMMKKIPAIARILGVAGVMPNPKNGTIGTDFEDMIKVIKSGKVDYRNDKSANIHIPCGKLNSNFNPTKIVENIKEAIVSVKKAKPEVIKKKYIISANLSSSMSPNIKTDFASV
jgi:large subunit ribosomal protein L1